MILGIDPSNTKHAWALVGGPLDRPELRSFGRDLVNDWPTWARGKDRTPCIEQIASYGLAVGAHVLDTCVEIGKLLAECPDAKRLTRIEVKRLICHRTSANDSNVRAAIIDRFGGPTAIKKGGQLYKVGGDTWAAIAVALAAMEPEAQFYVPVAERQS